MVEDETEGTVDEADATAPDSDPIPEGAGEADTAAPDTEPVASYEAQIVDPVEEAESVTEAAQDTEPEVPEGHVLVAYRGPADTFEHGSYTFRGAKPVAVPSTVAEELLTNPFERFERL